MQTTRLQILAVRAAAAVTLAAAIPLVAFHSDENPAAAALKMADAAQEHSILGPGGAGRLVSAAA